MIATAKPKPVKAESGHDLAMSLVRAHKGKPLHQIANELRPQLNEYKSWCKSKRLIRDALDTLNQWDRARHDLQRHLRDRRYEAVADALTTLESAAKRSGREDVIRLLEVLGDGEAIVDGDHHDSLAQDLVEMAEICAQQSGDRHFKAGRHRDANRCYAVADHVADCCKEMP